MDHDFLVLRILVSTQIGVGASVGFLVLWVLVSWMCSVCAVYNVQSVLGFGKSGWRLWAVRCAHW